MRTQRLLLTLALTISLLATPLALADAGKGRSARAEHDDDDDDRHEDRAARENFTENRSALMERFLGRLQAMQDSWHENATAVRETCRDTTETDRANATKEEHKAWAHCVRDGYRDWRVVNRADLKELRAELRALFEGWHAARKPSD